MTAINRLVVIGLVGGMVGYGQQQEITLSIPPPPAVTTVTAQKVSNYSSGGSRYYYWVLANYNGGSVISKVYSQVDDVAPLSGGSYVRVSWSGVGADSYTVVRSNTPSLPSANCSGCVVAAATTNLSVNDIGDALGNLNVTLKVGAVGRIMLDNSTGTLQWRLDPPQTNLTGLVAGAGGSNGQIQENSSGTLIGRDKQGNGTKVQMAGSGTPSNNDCAKFDAGGNVVSAGAPCGSGTSTDSLLKANNLSDLPSASTARTNLGLGTLAQAGTGTSSQIQKGNGTGGVTDASPGVDFLHPSAINDMVQAHDSKLDDISDLTCVDGQILKLASGVWTCGTDNASGGGGGTPGGSSGQIQYNNAGSFAGLDRQGNGTKAQMSTETSNPPQYTVAVYDANGNIVRNAYNCIINTNTLQCGDGTQSSGVLFKETTAGGGTYSFGIYGLDNQTADINICMPDTAPAQHDVLVALGTTETKTDGRVCRKTKWATMPSCSNATTSKLLYDTSTQAFSCGTDQTSGGGGGGGVLNVVTHPNASVSAGGTQYGFVTGSVAWGNTETARFERWPFAGTFSNGVLIAQAGASVGGTLICTLRINGATPGNSIVMTMPASPTTVPAYPSNVYTDDTHTVTIAAGDTVGWQCVNGNGGAASPIPQQISVKFTPTP